MLDVITTPEKLWTQCAQLAKSPKVIFSELYQDESKHFILAYGPVAQRNQYQQMLYSESENFNVSFLPIHDLRLFGAIPWPGKLICHFHWIHDITSQAKTEHEASASVLIWRKLLEQIKDNGHKICWTIHNVLPHESAWTESDIKVHQLVSDAADMIHVMATDSVKQTKPYYTLDEEKVFILPHPTYHGAQPDKITRSEARKLLDVGQEDFVFLSFGAVMEYKGYRELMAAYDYIRKKTKKRTRLVIAGLPTDKDLVSLIADWGSSKSDVTLDLSPVPNQNIQMYFRSADVAVCPYRRTMNSGAAMMAVTFDLPIVGPNAGGFADLTQAGCMFGYDSKDPQGLVSVMEHVLHNGVNEEKKKMEEIKKTLSPQNISLNFLKRIELLMR